MSKTTPDYNADNWPYHTSQHFMTAFPQYSADLASRLTTRFAQKRTVRSATTSDVLDQLTTGDYRVPSGAVATALGLPLVAHGTLVVDRYGSNGLGAGVATFISRTSPAIIWSYIWGASGPEGGWKRLTGRPMNTATSSDVLDDLPTGDYVINSAAVASSLGLPVAAHGVLQVTRWSAGGVGVGVATFTTRTAPAEIWSYVWAVSGAPEGGGWRRVTGNDSPAPVATGTDYGIRHQLIAARHEAAIGGPIDTGAAMPVCMVWDDYPGSFSAHNLAGLAAQYQIPLTLALTSRVFDAGFENLIGQGTSSSWNEVNSWVQDGWVEIAHHGATHSTNLSESDLYDEIVTSLDVLRTRAPGKPIDTWVMPTNLWPGLEEGRNADHWSSRAGQLILGHHAYAAGVWPSIPGFHVAPMTGKPIQGHSRLWVESTTLTPATRKSVLTRHYGTNRGAMLSAHAAWIGQTGRWDLPEVTAYFAWLREEEDAGRIKLLQLSQWPWAKVTA